MSGLRCPAVVGKCVRGAFRRGPGAVQPRHVRVSALHIDRRGALERAWQRQEQRKVEEDEEAASCSVDCLREIRDAAHLDHLRNESSVLVVDLYNDACGACKELEAQLRAVCKRRGAAGSGPVFLKHNIRNAYDELSDLAELYAFTRAPAVCILHDGAVKWYMEGRDVRRVCAAADHIWTQAQGAN